MTAFLHRRQQHDHFGRLDLLAIASTPFVFDLTVAYHGWPRIAGLTVGAWDIWKLRRFLRETR